MIRDRQILEQRKLKKATRYAEVSMKQFRESIDGDEQMLAFAADHLDEPDDSVVVIALSGKLVTFAIVPK